MTKTRLGILRATTRRLSSTSRATWPRRHAWNDTRDSARNRRTTGGGPVSMFVIKCIYKCTARGYLSQWGG